jgi:hypothetical protein
MASKYKTKLLSSFKSRVAQSSHKRRMLQCRMLRGGYLYYFNATTKNDNDNYIINQKIINTTKYRGVGIDIRCGQSGYAVTPGSRVYNKETKQIGFCNIEKDLPIIDVPSSLISWLTAFVPDKKQQQEKKKVNYIQLIMNTPMK